MGITLAPPPTHTRPRDAAALACVCRAAATALKASKWHRLVRVCRDGAVLVEGAGA